MYVRFGDNQALKAIFKQSGATEYNHRKLVEALVVITGPPGGPPPGAASTARRDGPGVATPGVATPGVATPGRRYAVAPNHPELVKRYRQRAMWKSQLTLLPTQDERRDQAFAILDLTDEIEDILFKGFTKPCDKGKLPEDRAALAKRLTTNRKYISKFRDRADKLDQIKERRAENQQIEQLLESPS